MRITKKIRRIRHALQRRALRRKYGGAFAHIAQCQSEIGKLNPSPHYSVYSAEEVWYSAHIVQWLLEDIAPGKTCLDIGAAYGTLALYCRKILRSDVYCVDFISHMSTQLAEKHGIETLIANFELDAVYPEKRFDYIVFTEVLEHFNFHPVPAMQKIRSLLAKDGKLYLSTPDAKHWGKTKYYKNYDDMPQPQPGKEILDDHLYQFNLNELMQVFADSGFVVEKLDYAPGPGDMRHFNFRLRAAA